MSTHSLLSLSLSLSHTVQWLLSAELQQQQQQQLGSCLTSTLSVMRRCRPAWLTGRMRGLVGTRSLAPTPFTELVVDTFQRRKSVCQVSRWAAAVRLGTNSPESPRSSSGSSRGSRRRCGGGASSDVIGQVEQARSRGPCARAPHGSLWPLVQSQGCNTGSGGLR